MKIAFFGMGGSGKTHYMEETKLLLQNHNHVNYCHLQNETKIRNIILKLLYNNHTEIELKLSKKPKTKIKSNFLTYLWIPIITLDAWLFEIRNRKKIVIMDRYFYDYALQFKQRRLISESFVNLWSKLLPKPEYIIYLDSPAKVLYKRKKEHSESYLEEQKKIYDQFVNRLRKNVVIEKINTNQKIEKSTAEFLQIIQLMLIEEIPLNSTQKGIKINSLNLSKKLTKYIKYERSGFNHLARLNNPLLKDLKKKWKEYKLKKIKTLKFIDSIAKKHNLNILIAKHNQFYEVASNDIDILIPDGQFPKLKSILKKIKGGKYVPQSKYKADYYQPSLLPIDIHSRITYDNFSIVEHKKIFEKPQIVNYENLKLKIPNNFINFLISSSHYIFENYYLTNTEFSELKKLSENLNEKKILKVAEANGWKREMRIVQKTINKNIVKFPYFLQANDFVQIIPNIIKKKSLMKAIRRIYIYFRCIPLKIKPFFKNPI